MLTPTRSKQVTRTPHVVIVDDDIETRDMLVVALEQEGVRVTAFRDGVSLVDFVEASAEPIDLILTDVRMKEMGGLVALGVLRELGTRIPVLFMTAFGDETTVDAAMRLGAVGVLHKPFDLDEVRTAVDYLARRSSPPPALFDVH